MLEISEALQRDILKYMQTRPYFEVVTLISQVASLKKQDNGKNKKNEKHDSAKI